MSNLRKVLTNYFISSAILSSQTNRSLSSTSVHSSHPMTTSSPSSDPEFSIAYVTAPNGEVAKEIANKIVSARLSACVNILPSITSIYQWKGKMETESEVLMMIKTRTELIQPLTAMVKDSHPYEVFELISVPVRQTLPPLPSMLMRLSLSSSTEQILNGNPDYIKWLSEELPKK